MKRLLCALLLFPGFLVPAEEQEISLTLFHRESAKITTTPDIHVYLGNVKNEISHLVSLVHEKLKGLSPALTALQERLSQGYVTAPLNLVKEALENAYQSFNNYFAPEEGAALKRVVARYYQALHENQLTAVEYRAPREEENLLWPPLEQITYIPRGLYVQGNAVIGGDLTVSGTINGLDIDNNSLPTYGYSYINTYNNISPDVISNNDPVILNNAGPKTSNVTTNTTTGSMTVPAGTYIFDFSVSGFSDATDDVEDGLVFELFDVTANSAISASRYCSDSINADTPLVDARNFTVHGSGIATLTTESEIKLINKSGFAITLYGVSDTSEAILASLRLVRIGA